MEQNRKWRNSLPWDEPPSKWTDQWMWHVARWCYSTVWHAAALVKNRKASRISVVILQQSSIKIQLNSVKSSCVIWYCVTLSWCKLTLWKPSKILFYIKTLFSGTPPGLTEMCCILKGDKHTNRSALELSQSWEMTNLKLNTVNNFSTDINNVWSSFQTASVLFLLKSFLLPPHLSVSMQIQRIQE